MCTIHRLHKCEPCCKTMTTTMTTSKICTDREAMEPKKSWFSKAQMRSSPPTNHHRKKRYCQNTGGYPREQKRYTIRSEPLTRYVPPHNVLG